LTGATRIGDIYIADGRLLLPEMGKEQASLKPVDVADEFL